MSLENVRKRFESFLPYGKGPLYEIAVGSLKLISTLEQTHYFDDIQVKDSVLTMNFPVPDREGQITIYFDEKTNKYMIRGERIPSHPSNWLETVQIHNVDSPIQEIEAYIERVKPQLPVAWKR